MLAALCAPALALNPSLDIHQYALKAWTIRDGFFESGIQTIAQTPDGYLWLGTEIGLLRFDGVRKVSWQPPAGERLPSSDIRTLLVTRDGSLWIGTRAGLATWKGGRLIHYPELAGQIIGALVEDDGEQSGSAEQLLPLEGSVLSGGAEFSALARMAASGVPSGPCSRKTAICGRVL